jgi:hypothetical protein
MTLSPEGCDVISHDPLCLCDVKITDPVSPNYLAIPHEMLNGEALAYFGKWDGTIPHWCELVNKVTPTIDLFRKHANAEEVFYFSLVEPTIEKTLAPSRFLPADVYAYLVRGIRRGMQPTPLRQEIIDEFGYTINKSYVTHLRKRLQQKGEL